MIIPHKEWPPLETEPDCAQVLGGKFRGCEAAESGSSGVLGSIGMKYRGGR